MVAFLVVRLGRLEVACQMAVGGVALVGLFCMSFEFCLISS